MIVASRLAFSVVSSIGPRRSQLHPGGWSLLTEEKPGQLIGELVLLSLYVHAADTVARLSLASSQRFTKQSGPVIDASGSAG